MEQGMTMPIIPIPKFEGFVLYDPVTQLFSRGGDPNQWGKKPKIWRSVGHMKNSFNGEAVQRHYIYNDPNILWKDYKVQITINPKFFRYKAINIVSNDEAFDMKTYLYEYAARQAKTYVGTSLPIVEIAR